MTKKGYQTRLPKVLPPRCRRRAPPTRRPARGSRATRTGRGTRPRPARPRPARPRPARRRPARPPSRPTPSRPTPLCTPRRQSLRRSNDGAPRALLVGFALIGLVNLVVVGLILYAILGTDEEDGPTAKPAGRCRTGATTRPRTSRTSRREAQSDGDLVVHQWIRGRRADRPAPPRAPDGAGRRRPVRDADRGRGRRSRGRRGRTGSMAARATYTFEDDPDVEVRYRLRARWSCSDSAPGRALALTTALDVTYTPRTQRARPGSSAPRRCCRWPAPRPAESPVPCGEDDGDGQWRVELDGPTGGRPRRRPADPGLSVRRALVVEAVLDGPAGELDAVVHLELAQGVLDVVLHGAVRQHQSRGDLLVAHPGRDHLEDLGLALGELVDAGRRPGRPRSGGTRPAPDPARPGGEDGVTVGDPHHGVDELGAGGRLHEVARRTRLDRLEHVVLLAAGREDQHPRGRVVLEHHAGDLDARCGRAAGGRARPPAAPPPGTAPSPRARWTPPPPRRARPPAGRARPHRATSGGRRPPSPSPWIPHLSWTAA